jgi:rhodanese-related sulfurtransferase
MIWTNLAIVVAMLALVLAIRRSGRVSARDAAIYLRKGAMIIDVRSAGEFTAGHLPRAVNIPLSEIETLIERKTTDKCQVLLLYCKTGARSGQAKSRLRVMGYANAFNLGPYTRAAEILGDRSNGL